MDVARDDSPQHPVPGVAPAYLESRIAIGERWKPFFQTRFFSAIKSKNDSNHSSDPNKKNSLNNE